LAPCRALAVFTAFAGTFCAAPRFAEGEIALAVLVFVFRGLAGGFRCACFRANERDEPDLEDFSFAEVAFFIFFIGHQHLIVNGSDGGDETPSGAQLVKKRLGNTQRGGCKKDAVIGRGLGPPKPPVSDMNANVRESEPHETFGGLLRQRRNALDRMNLGREQTQDRRLVSASAADFENLFAASSAGSCASAFAQPKQLGHDPDDIGLRNGLAESNREREISPGFGAVFLWHKEMTRNAPHGLEHPFVRYIPAAQLLLDHSFRAPLPVFAARAVRIWGKREKRCH